MAKLDNCVLARLKKNGHTFEIYIDPYLAWDYKHGQNVNFDDMIGYDVVYSDALKGNETPKTILKEVFNTEDFQTIAKQIIKEGEVQLTTAQRHELTEKREKEIMDFIARNAHDPKTKTPIPLQRIINAFEELKIKVNINTPKEKEIEEIIEKLKRVMPLSLEKITLEIEIPAIHAGKANGILYKYEITEQKLDKNGNLIAKIKIPSGMRQQLINEINNITHGNAIINIQE